jgi:hypothetical protein
LRRLDIAFTAFFKRCKQGKKPGSLRFKAKARFHSAMLRVGDGRGIKDGGIRILGVARRQIGQRRFRRRAYPAGGPV